MDNLYQTRAMTEHTPEFTRFDERHLQEVLELSIRAWRPVFPAMQREMPSYIYDAFYPEGWETRQRTDIAAVCRDKETDVWVAHLDGTLCGFIGLRVHDEDSMGEIYVLAVDPDCQRRGVGSALIAFAFDWMREQNLAMAMVETGGDQGHAPSRATYEHAGFERLPVARYFRKL